MTKLDQVILDLRNELGNDFFAIDVVGSDGLPIASASILPDYDHTMISARAIMITKLAQKVADKLDMGDIEESLMTTDKSYQLLRPIGDGSYCVTLAIKKDAILGTAKMYLNEFCPQIWDNIPH